MAKSGRGAERVEVKMMVDPQTWKLVRVRAIMTDRTISDVVNEVLGRAARQWASARGLAAAGAARADTDGEAGETGEKTSEGDSTEDGEDSAEDGPEDTRWLGVPQGTPVASLPGDGGGSAEGVGRRPPRRGGRHQGFRLKGRRG